MKKTIYTANYKKIIGLIFILLGIISVINSLIGLIGYCTKNIIDYEYYNSFIELASVLTWILLALILKRIERIGAILMVMQLLTIIVILPIFPILNIEDITLFPKIISAIGILAYVFFVMSKSLSPFRIPAMTYLIATLWYTMISAFTKIPELDGISHLLPITRLFYLAGGIITIVSFCKWNYNEDTTISVTQ